MVVNLHFYFVTHSMSMLQNPSVDVSSADLSLGTNQLLDFFRIKLGYNFKDAQNLTFLTQSYRPIDINADIIPSLLKKIQNIGRYLLRGAVGVLSFLNDPNSTNPGPLTDFRNNIMIHSNLKDTYKEKLEKGYRTYVHQLKEGFSLKKKSINLETSLPLLPIRPSKMIYSLVAAVFIDSNFNFEIVVTFLANLFDIDRNIDFSSCDIFPYQKEFRGMEHEIKYSFKNKLLKTAVLNPQKFNIWGRERNKIIPDPRALAFLGDSILDVVIASWVINRLAIEKITKQTISAHEIRHYINNQFLHEVGVKRGIVKLFEALRESHKEETVANFVEAIIGAIYLDTNQDFEVTYRETLVLLFLDRE